MNRLRTDLAHIRLTIPPVHLGLQATLPELEVAQEPPAVLIDVTAPLEEVGLKRPETLAREAAELGQQQALAGTARRAQEGDRLQDMHLGVQVAELAAAAARPPERELNVDIAPRSRPHIEVELGSVSVHVRPGQVSVDVPFELVKVDLTRPPLIFGQEKVGAVLDTYG